jgi:hypothetical protein
LTDEERQVCLDNFVKLPTLLLKNGHLLNEEFLDRGFPPDTNYKEEEEVHELARISQEHCQQAKTLSHEHQVRLRADLVEEKMATVRKKQEEAVPVSTRRSLTNRAGNKRQWTNKPWWNGFQHRHGRMVSL